MTRIRQALSLVRLPALLQQAALAVAVCGLLVLWFRLPDSSGIWVMLTVVLGCMIAAALALGEGWIFLKLCGRPANETTLPRAALTLAIAVLAWWAWITLTGILAARFPVYAPYFNSRLPAPFRGLHSADHIEWLLKWALTLIEWLGDALIALCAGNFILNSGSARAFSRASRPLSFWVSALCFAYLATALNSLVSGWTPGHGARVELLSLVLRFTLLFATDVFLLCFAVALLFVYLADNEADTGTPVLSQPRTVENP